MRYGALCESDRKLLDQVLGITGDDEKRIEFAVKKVMNGIGDRARRVYLWNQLSKLAKENILRAHSKAAKVAAGKAQLATA